MASIIRELHGQLVKKERSAVEITQEVLDRIQALEPKIHSFLCVTADKALEQAKAVDAKIAAGEEIGLLAGIPVGVKDNMCTKGIPTTCASKILENFVPPYESTVTQKLADAGAVTVGKTNLDEFAMGSSTENSAFQLTANPWDLERVPGGSSGGSAAAVAAHECVVSLGSDTGGSIRQPASFCGVVGMKPTYGLVSRYGLVAFASSLDQIGPFGRTVEDAAILLGAIAGYDPKDSTSLKVEIPDYTQFLKPDLKSMRIGIVRETFAEGLDPAVEQAVNKAIEQLKQLGAEIKEVSCPRFRYGLPTYYIIAPSEASANLARYDGVKYGLRVPDAENLIDMYARTRAMGFGKEVKRRIMVGTYALSAGYYDAYYLKAQKVRTLIKQDFETAFGQVDVLVTPTVPMTAFKAGEKTDDPLSMYLTDLMTITVNLAGLPGLSIPCGFDEKGMPIGMQLIGNVLREDQLFQVAHAYEQATEWHKSKPSL
ncbi:MAG: Glutamyl-tRNA(Gln) amidotransferase subunit A [Chroococcidiopsis cubana SAG 39.79]|jgi:aspartyl-tRNA(Asn)/glutamyl-tRNA(Gln) amidotransferase subunit A|uniref:Glutamyl-tRNA(Gln) amidotransferase subunit A n=1 Tax=Chroococcidiopsis cubana SAG 39.79 TaxID=388085 RepID=A0AB37USA7_9CYAN|nr:MULTISPECIES: Asp-tRNA(Asn)/Glu-tRNA(Gln) amidotransferase subunit GatA [Chroococcidiopsis]MDZ4875683.1 Glutamyl-tRNA(Gln) amidotransferase subunit A [Chroococcidiopsis cubana SAG 39.79]PSB62626.1 Asp-tRNA(Asn)/Glu-tRNA(Gln) amidotransferase GatCAB subunit A [Chroococcidiopsis cubana CCALA 043]PSM48768.1 Asp-tRNA(Asn)/Glu-tRNA(Gln) amidotransferase GatCAB subunit A [Chroococcidiopsis sp. CCALA 051]RUT14345.1 glutamyl-tRNA(Gln) amidotransferase subunit A [Chroococcidiopsis cubana SAG 39.79]